VQESDTRKQGFNFINVLRAAFTCTDTKSAKKTVKSSSFFTLSGSVSVKAACRMLMKLTRDFQFKCSAREFSKTGSNIEVLLQSKKDAHCLEELGLIL